VIRWALPVALPSVWQALPDVMTCIASMAEASSPFAFDSRPAQNVVTGSRFAPTIGGTAMGLPRRQFEMGASSPLALLLPNVT
jgi:hypothetical protein